MAQEFCPHCSQPIDADARFCPHCGQQILRPGMAPPPVDLPGIPAGEAPGGVAGSEMPLLTLAVQFKQGMLKSTGYILVLTPQRIIMAVYDNKRFQKFMEQERMAAKERGDGFFKKMGNTMMSGFKFIDQYRVMPPQAILAENPANFFVPLAEVEWFRYHKSTRTNYDENSSSSDTTIKIEYRAGGRDFKMTVPTMGNKEKEYIQHFRQLFQERFQYK